MISARDVHTFTNPGKNTITTERSYLKRVTMTRVRNTCTKVNKDRNGRLLFPMFYVRRSSSSHDRVSSFHVYEPSGLVIGGCHVHESSRVHEGKGWGVEKLSLSGWYVYPIPA